MRTAALCAAALLAVVAAAGSTLLGAARSEAGADPAPSLPELEVRCTAVPPAARGRRGREAAVAATAAIERYPFDPRAGLAALQRLREAARCFELAGERSAHADSEARAEAWRGRLLRDCRDHFLRYRLAHASERLEHALADVEFLLALCAPGGGPLAARLRRARVDITERHQSEETP